MRGLRYWVAKKWGLENQSLWQRLMISLYIEIESFDYGIVPNFYQTIMRFTSTRQIWFQIGSSFLMRKERKRRISPNENGKKEPNKELLRRTKML